jgi:hypothetical protein
LRRKGKRILFLNATKALVEDDITTLVYDANNNKLAYHTWYARSYGVTKAHTERIDNVFKQINIPEPTVERIIYFKDSFFSIKYKMKKNWMRVKMKLESLLK